MAVFNSLTIGGINSLDYGIYITGEGVYDAPNRAVEMVEIHGRNGALILDKGHFENIEIKYPCGSFGEGNKTFEQRITEFKNAVLSLKGYQRLTDTYATDVYRLASCANGFEVAPVQGGKAGEFDLVFNCKPQRFLTSGETLVTVANNGTVTNPTAFDSQPTIQVNGYGTLTFNGYEVTIENGVMGEYELMGAFSIAKGKSITLPTSGYNNGDTIIFNLTSHYGDYIDVKLPSGCAVTTVSVTSGEAAIYYDSNRSHFGMDMRFNDQVSATAGTASAISKTAAILVTYTSGGSTYTTNAIISSILTYKANGTVEYTANISDTSTLNIGSARFQGASIVVDSTVYILGNPTVIDCELGEAYKVENNQFISLNAYIDLGSDLPTLAPGTNTFTKSNTITSLKVKPNWWKL